MLARRNGSVALSAHNTMLARRNGSAALSAHNTMLARRNGSAALSAHNTMLARRNGSAALSAHNTMLARRNGSVALSAHDTMLARRNGSATLSARATFARCNEPLVEGNTKRVRINALRPRIQKGDLPANVTRNELTTEGDNADDGPNPDAPTAIDLRESSVQAGRMYPSTAYPCVNWAHIDVREPHPGDSLSAVNFVKWRGVDYTLRWYHANVMTQLGRALGSAPNLTNLNILQQVAPLLRHPNIVDVVAFVNAEDSAGLLMKRAPRSLGSVVLSSQKRIHRATTLKWLHDAAKGLTFAHGCGVTHSDIRPDNIILFDSQQFTTVAKVTDLVSARIRSTVASSDSPAPGEPMFIAPEYAMKETGPTKASDVFSFGMTMWCALVPRGTDHGLGGRDVQVAALNKGRRPPLAGLSGPLRTTIEQCWAPKPPLRPSMAEVEVVLRALVEGPTPYTVVPSLPPSAATPMQRSVTSSEVPSTELWSTFLRSYDIEPAFRELQFHYDEGVHFSDPITDPTNPCYRLISSLTVSLESAIERVVMVGKDTSNIDLFIKLHEAQIESRKLNPALRRENPTDAASVAGLNHLKQSFVPVETAAGEPLPLARLLLAWHGTAPKNVTPVCRDGLLPLRKTDSGFFGGGSYFALEPDHAARFSQLDDPQAKTGERAIILFAVSVSQAKVITLEGDYRLTNEILRNGFSDYYSGKENASLPLAPGYDAHIIPVKDYDRTHPLIPSRNDLPIPVDFQAVDEPSGTAMAHELVIDYHRRSTPLAVVYFNS